MVETPCTHGVFLIGSLQGVAVLLVEHGDTESQGDAALCHGRRTVFLLWLINATPMANIVQRQVTLSVTFALAEMGTSTHGHPGPGHYLMTIIYVHECVQSGDEGM